MSPLNPALSQKRVGNGGPSPNGYFARLSLGPRETEPLDLRSFLSKNHAYSDTYGPPSMNAVRRTDSAGAIASILTSLAERPGSLLCALLALDLVALPYAGLTRDGMLYSGQVLNRALGGYLDGDLFFKFGSQDRFSAFSPILAPAVPYLGITLTFLIGYLATKALLLYGLQRLAFRAIPSPEVAVASLLMVATYFLPFGASGLLTLNESVLTPRLGACGLALLAIDATMSARWFRASLLACAGFVLHPIMALPAIGVCVAYVVWTRLPGRIAGAVAIAAAVVGLVALTPPIGYRLFGEMSATWLDEVVHYTGGLLSPQAWSPPSWPRIVLAFGLCLGAAWRLRIEHPDMSRLLGSIALVSAGGLLVSTIANELGYRLLAQAQVHRALYLVEFAQFPAGLWLGTKLFFDADRGLQLMGVVLIFALLDLSYLTQFDVDSKLKIAMLCAGAFVIAFVAIRGIEKAPRRPDWLSRVFAWALGVGSVTWAIYLAMLFAAYHAQYANLYLERQVWRAAFEAMPLLPRLLLALLLVGAVGRMVGWDGAFRLVALGVSAVAAWTACYVPTTIYDSAGYHQFESDIRFVDEYLGKHPAGQPTIYWPNDRLDMVWVDLKASSYYHRYQAAGIVFSEPMSHETARRIERAGPFEFHRSLAECEAVTDQQIEGAAAYWGVDLDHRTPSEADLRKLCADPCVDYLVLRQKFDGLYAAENGHVYIYDCRRIAALP
jgi:hypothetical protein